MRSIDNLREYALTAASVNATTRAVLAGYIDGIEREVDELRDRDYRNGCEDAEGAVEFADRLCHASERREDVTLWGVDYMAYPLDADGMPIHVGDWITGKWDAKAKVEAVTSDDVYWWEPDGCHWCHAHEVRHHHAPTVEDVLYDSLRHFGAVEERTPEVEEWLHEQAAKLRLAGEE